MAKIKKFRTNGNNAMKEEDIMEAMSEAQAAATEVAPVNAEVTQQAATPEVAQTTQPEKVGFFTKVKTGVQKTGKKIWDNRGKIGVAVGAIGTIAGAIAVDRIRNKDNFDDLEVIDEEDFPEEIQEETESTEE